MRPLLEEMGCSCGFSRMSPDIDEKALRDEDPAHLVLLIARAKAQALLPKAHECPC